MYENRANVYCARSHTGWSECEEDLLFNEVETAGKEGRPLKSVFDRVAETTGRKPNSVRNYYYARIKDEDVRERCGTHSTAFVPFTDSEIEELLRTVLSAQAHGMSVRACTLMMGAGDNRAMLRYQNKYRSVVANDSATVKRVVEKMRAEGLDAFDPYTDTAPRKSGRPRKRDIDNAAQNASKEIAKLTDIDTDMFFASIELLAKKAELYDATKHNICEREAEIERLSAENAELKEQLSIRSNELTAQKERFGLLMAMFRQLMQINSEFLRLNSVVKMSSLGNYINDLSKYVEDFEKTVGSF